MRYSTNPANTLPTVKGLKHGDSESAAAYVGAITRAPQIAVLEAQVADALSKGAELLTGGKPDPAPGNWFAPTVLVNVNHGMELMREESFGPIIGIQKVSSDAQAVQRMNDTRYGLTAGVYTLDQAPAATVGPSERWHGVLELLGPRQPAPSQERPWRRGRGPDFVKRGISTLTWPRAWHLRQS